VAGPSGSGKSTLARRLANALAVPHIELDAIFHQPGWTELSTKEFRDRVSIAINDGGWVIDGNYAAVRDLVWAAADTVVWLDLPRATVMRRIIARTFHRAITRQELWNGNRESIINVFRLDPQKNIIRWSWVKHPEYAARYARTTADPANAHLRFIRIRSGADIDELMSEVTASASSTDASPGAGSSDPVRMDRDDVMRWVAGYEQAWRDGDLAAVERLFTDDARYRPSPYDESEVGHDAIKAFWLDDEGEVFTVQAEPVAVEGRHAVVRVEVRYGDPVRQEYRDLWLLCFADDGRVEDYEEWA